MTGPGEKKLNDKGFGKEPQPSLASPRRPADEPKGLFPPTPYLIDPQGDQLPLLMRKEDGLEPAV